MAEGSKGKLSRVAQLKDKYPDQADSALDIADPKHKNKYLLWIGKQLHNGHNRPDITATIREFHKQPSKFEHSDIYRYEDLKTLEDEIKNLDKSRRQKEKDIKDIFTKVIHDNDDYLLIRVDSKDAILYYGKGSQWCITMNDSTYWEDYHWDGNIFYVLIHKKSNSKHAIQRTSALGAVMWDVHDRSQDLHKWVTQSTSRKNGLEHIVLKLYQDDMPTTWTDIRTGKSKRVDVVEWLKTQHKSTRQFIYKKHPYLTIDTSNANPRKNMSNLKQKELRDLNDEDPSFLPRVIEALKENKREYSKLRIEVGNVFPDARKDIYTELQLFDLKASENPDMWVSLIFSDDQQKWQKAVRKAPLDVLLLSLGRVRDISKVIRIKERIFAEVNQTELLKWVGKICGDHDIKIPSELWENKYENRKGRRARTRR